MAAVNNLVTGGIGPASEIKYLLTGGLEIGEAAQAPDFFQIAASDAPAWSITVSERGS